MSKFNVNEKGYYGSFGGAFIPEMLYKNIDELKKSYLDILESRQFKKEFHQLFRLL